MALTRIKCPECGAGLKSPTGFTTGEAVECPKCETHFTVEEPAYEEVSPAKKPMKAVASRVNDDDDDEKPRKKKKSRRDDDDDDDEEETKRSYKNSPMRFAVLGVLVLIMIVLGVLLVIKKIGEREVVKADPDDDPPANTDPPNNFVPPKNFVPPPPLFKGPGINNGKGPGNDPIKPKDPFNNGNDPFAPPPIGGFLGGMPAKGTPQAEQHMEKLKSRLIGTWEGSLPNGSMHKVEYKAGLFTHTITGGPNPSSTNGAWFPLDFVGNKGLKLRRGAGFQVTVIFEDDELLHDTGNPGEVVVLRKK